ncbi:hypothetical protein [Acetivibrio clariflavus]|uniref:Uncharacterized protein n=1 Tax=Acetivibrio clariflavus (strain DSM 19732 / NBRC 101661 / EBR45) TaxID=720554 RepID=G8LZI8_ACECE|nr:hypothetical protein [Acetivibrio clariflavus]AEV66851.1 hypothetical protein Clocl_0097 [Acetivibrio clariflavus DSM 19732]
MFNMELKAIVPLDAIKKDIYDFKDYDDELDDGRSIIKDICEIFADTGKILFSVSGFGDENWAVDCSFDLPVIIEQLPEIIRKINNNDYNFVLDFYEQGIEREIEFIDGVQFVKLICKSRNDWSPQPSEIEMSKKDICTIFMRLYESFLSLSEVLCRDLINHHLFREWMNI